MGSQSVKREAAGTPEDPVLAAGVILWRRRAAVEFLLLRNAVHGTWGFPKGHLHVGEGLRAAALRELREETGIELAEADLARDFADTCIYQPDPGRWKRVVHYLAELPAGQEFQRSPEHDEGEWFTEQDALQLLDKEGTRRALIRAAERLRRP